jgi:exopolysaccharide biosynthesis polyprenyl glycosylphosphotransferase
LEETQAVLKSVAGVQSGGRIPGSTAARLDGRALGGEAALPAEVLRTTRVEPADDRRELARKRDARFRRALALADGISVALAIWLGIHVIGGHEIAGGALLLLLVVIVAAKALGLYDRDENLLHKTTLEEIPALFQVATVSTLLVWLLSDPLASGVLKPGSALSLWLLLVGLIPLGRSLARQIARRLSPVERCLVLGSPEAAAELEGKIGLSGYVKAELVGYMPLEKGPSINGSGPLPDIPDNFCDEVDARGVQRVVVAPGQVTHDALMYLVQKLQGHDVKVSVLPATARGWGGAEELDPIHGLTLTAFRRLDMTRSTQMLKRAFDFCVSSVALLLVSPLLAAIAVAIRLDSPGPVLFRQRRVGKDGELFEMLKFRSMVTEADQRREELSHLNEAGDGLFKIADDPRVTRVGRLIRRSSLDELPQLINVLRGEMSLVGPRPLIPAEDAQIEGWYRNRLKIRPGITGYWQYLGSSRIPLNEMVRLDMSYVSGWSLWKDVRIVMRTIPHVFARRGL